MACLLCQKPFEIHSREALLECIEWIGKQHHERSVQVNRLIIERGKSL